MPSEVLIARQPVFDRARKVYGYELLHRSDAAVNRFDGTEAESASKQVMANSLMAFGLDRLVNGKKAFVNFNKGLLVAKWNTALPSDRAVIEILETVEPDQEVIEACGQLKRAGYRLALDDFAFQPRKEKLLELVDLVKVEIGSLSRQQQEARVRFCHAKGLQMLAEKVETYEEFEWARAAGYDYFQGYFFARPEILRSKQISAGKLQCLRLLQETRRPQLDLKRLEELVHQDVSFSYKLLRYVNSALFHRNQPIRSTRQAFTMLGEDFLRRWIAMAVLSQVAHNKPSELVTQSLARGFFCEAIAGIAENRDRADLQRRKEQAFFMGMFSLLDAILDRPLADALAEVHLEKPITDALLGEQRGASDATLSSVYQLIQNYESNEWDAVIEDAKRLGLEGPAVGKAYCDAIAATDQALSGPLEPA